MSASSSVLLASFPFNEPSTLRTLQVMRGISHLPTHERTRLPITMPLLRQLCYRIRLPQLRSPHDKSMLQAAVTLGFHGFLRCSELINLTRKDVSISEDLATLAITIRHSKTDQSGKGFTLLIGASPDQGVCPVQALHRYIMFNNKSDQLFVYSSGAGLTKQDITREVRNLLPGVRRCLPRQIC